MRRSASTPSKGFPALLAIAAALLAFAWWERSVLLGVVGGLFAIHNLLVPGLILIAGGAVAAVAKARSTL